MSDVMLDVYARLREAEKRLARLEAQEQPRGLISSGASFPGSPAADDRFFRTDLDWLCVYDGTRWLTVHEYSSDFTPYARSVQPFTGTSGALLVAPLTNSYGVFLTGAAIYLDVATTNSAANYWQLALKAGATTLWSFDTSAIAPNTYTRFGFSVSTLIASPSFFSFEVTGRVGAPGGLVIQGMTYYRVTP